MNDSDGTHHRTRPPPPRSSTRLANSSPLSQMAAMHNPIQLAAISNYKLAQLTFSPPNQDSLRKTALVKNMLELLYEDTPSEWLDQMTRWEFFTPDSLSDMTQESLEEMFAQYAQTMGAFQSSSTDIPEGEEEDAERLSLDSNVGTPLGGSERSIFSQINATVSSDTIARTNVTQMGVVEKPLPQSPSDDSLFSRRSSTTPSVRNKNRLSWTSDTGVLPSNSVSQTMATELMSLFDMEFKVDIKLNTAPKLPELPFRQQNKKDQFQSKRDSSSSLMELIPAFEMFDIQDPPTSRHPWSTASDHLLDGSIHSSSAARESNSSQTSLNHPPKRSSSLQYRRQHHTWGPSTLAEKNKRANIRTRSNEFLASLAQGLVPGKDVQENKHEELRPRKNTLRRWTSLVTGKRDKASPPPTPAKDQRHQVYLCVPASSEDRSISTTSTLSSLSDFAAQPFPLNILEKPLPAQPPLASEAFCASSRGMAATRSEPTLAATWSSTSLYSLASQQSVDAPQPTTVTDPALTPEASQPTPSKSTPSRLAKRVTRLSRRIKKT